MRGQELGSVYPCIGNGVHLFRIVDGIGLHFREDAGSIEMWWS
jgi:hypothetical protein